MRSLVACLLLAAAALLAAAVLPAEALPSQALIAKRARERAAKRGRGRGGHDARLLAEGTDYVGAATARYLSNDELGAWLKDFEQRCKPIAKVHQIGTSGQGRPIWALELSDRPGEAEAEPAVKYVGNVHGDEPSGRALTMALAEWLCAHWRSEPRAKRIVTTMHLWLVPAMNPDGFEARTRSNSAGIDLNRDFPDRFGATKMQPSGSEQPETRAIMDWSAATGFVAAASMHEGALVANYPWDGTPDKSSRYEACPDDAAFKHLAGVYARAHATMALPTNTEFPHGGTTNGAAWYPIYGSMQDWNYIVGNCLELTLELSPDKWPAETLLPLLWEHNRDALLAFPLAAAYGGLWGTVRQQGKLRGSKGAELAPLGDAVITVAGLDKAVQSHAQRGDFYRPLAPGRYTVTLSHPGFKPLTHNLTVPADGSGAQRHFLLVAEGSPGEGGVAFSLKALARSEEAAAAAAAAGGGSDGGGTLPWKGMRKGGPADREGGGLLAPRDGVTATRGRDRLVMLGSGVLVVYGLWLTHTRIRKRSHPRRA